MTIDREALREKVARAICRVEYEDPDKEVIGGQAQAFYNYGPRWRAASNGCLGETDYLAMADAAISALDQPAQEPVAYQRLKDGKWEQCTEFVAKGWGDTLAAGCRALYAATQPATLPDELSAAIRRLRAICNEKIDKINQGRGVKTEGFRDINDLLKACDRVFASYDSKPKEDVWQPTKIPYSKDAQNAVMTLLEQGKVYVDNQGYLSLVKGDVDVVMDTIHPKA